MLDPYHMSPITMSPTKYIDYLKTYGIKKAVVRLRALVEERRQLTNYREYFTSKGLVITSPEQLYSDEMRAINLDNQIEELSYIVTSYN